MHSKDGQKSLRMCQESLSEVDTSHSPGLEHSQGEFGTCGGPKGWENPEFLQEAALGAVPSLGQAVLLLPLEFWTFPVPVSFQEIYKDANSQVHTLRKMVKEKEEAIQRQSTLEKKIHELEKQGTIKIQKKGDGDISILPVALGSGMVPAGAEAVPGTCGTPGAATSVPLPPPPPPLPALPGSPEAGEEGWGSHRDGHHPNLPGHFQRLSAFPRGNSC